MASITISLFLSKSIFNKTCWLESNLQPKFAGFFAQRSSPGLRCSGHTSIRHCRRLRRRSELGRSKERVSNPNEKNMAGPFCLGIWMFSLGGFWSFWFKCVLFYLLNQRWLPSFQVLDPRFVHIPKGQEPGTSQTCDVYHSQDVSKSHAYLIVFAFVEV